MKIFTAQQLHEADQITQKNQQITSLELMERASTKIFEEINNRLNGAEIKIKVFCGIGNNGGDGLVVARKLMEQGYQVDVYVVNYSDKRSDGFLANYRVVKEETKSRPVLLKSEEDFPEIKSNDFVIDAIFGIGLNRPLVGWVQKLITRINDSKAFKVAIDMPSGMLADGVIEDQPIVEANYTLTFQAPKLAFFLPETASYAGNVQIIDIGIDRKYLAETSAKAILIGKEQAVSLYQPRSKFTHKGDYGHAYIVGGSYGMMGSVVLSSKAALRTGVGKLTSVIPQCGYDILQTSLPEAMVNVVPHDIHLVETQLELKEGDIIGFGMGAGTHEKSIELLTSLLHQVKTPMLIDADGLNMLSKHPELLELIPEKSVLTPHPKELERLIGSWNNDFEKLDKVQEFSKKYKVTIVVKGSYTMTISSDNIYINTTGNPGMATAGSGDVLSGVITGLLAQGYDPAIAAVFGVYIHAQAGDMVIADSVPDALIAGDIIEYLGKAIRSLFEKPETKA